LQFRVLILGALIAFSAAGQTPGRNPQPSPSQNELNAPVDFGSESVNPQTQEINSPPSAWRSLGSLIFVLAIAGGGVWALRKWGLKKLPGSGGTRIKVEETLALGERRFVSILKVDDESFLIASYPQGLSLLARLDGSVEPGFDQQLDQQMHIQAPIPVREMEAQLNGELP
jgi:flagellar biogenesis protein FliO